ncbi:pseudo histidine-containing phosphotransfer protein 2-like isoform X2 [Lycium barbarum]|uniref:pseudo histidine-containing phosphotransfer protein 2-like isoform X2 n=1 Tax=Lycium barbarum TaxID=112863 RepID=UPI00293ECB9B|nr:pseudo histidine-containing phosphotransfer protein 2-like isoform X2 [Lycium barbarum]XP_060209841.1 pseudo histidine-containing phosphotransfer protein 2-like isoform X2 [Lycium barbarum]
MASDFARYIAKLRQLLFDEEILNRRFVELEWLENDAEGFLEDVYGEYFRDAAKILRLMGAEMKQRPYHIPEIKRLLNRFKKKTISIGAVKVKHQINCMWQNLKRGDFEALTSVFEGIKRENELVQFRLESYFKVRKQGPPAEIEDRPEYGYMDTDSE